MEALGLILAAAVGVHVEDAVDVSDDRVRQILNGLERAIDQRTKSEVRTDDPIWAACPKTDRCVDEIQARLEVEDVVLVRIVGAVRVDRVILERIGRVPRIVSADIPRVEDAAAKLSLLVADLFEPVMAPRLEVEAVVTEVDPFPVLPVVLGGVSVVMIAAAVAFGVSSKQARDASQDMTLTFEEYDPLADRAQAHGITADVLFGMAALSATTALILWILDV